RYSRVVYTLSLHDALPIWGQVRVPIRTGGQEEAIVMGAIDADAVEAALLAHKDEFRLCYERELNAEHPNMSGSVGTAFTIGSSGDRKSTRLNSSHQIISYA